MNPDDRALADLVAVLVDGGAAGPAPVERVRWHGLAALAYTHGRTEFRADYAAASIRAEQQRAVAAEAVEALEREGIGAVLFKGISYAAWLYTDPGERPMSDVDLLVRAEDHARAVKALARLGYWHPGPWEQRSERHHALTLKRAGGCVDLHRSPMQVGRIAIDWDALWARTSAAEWVPGARRLDLVDEVLFHFAHLVRQDLIAPLIVFVDAGRLLARLDGAAWEAVLARARAWRFARVLDAAVETVDHVIGRRALTRWWLPDLTEIVRGATPSRPVQLARRALLFENVRGITAYSASVLDGVIAARFRVPSVNAGAPSGVERSDPPEEP